MAMKNLDRFDDRSELEREYMQQVEVVMINSKMTQLMGDVAAQNDENLKERA